jgi:hypothetical protein
MTLLPKLKTGWKKLDDILDLLRLRVNERSVSNGAGIDMQSGVNGCVLSLAVATAQDPTANPSTGGSGGSGGGAGTPTDLSALSARVAALEAILASSGWMSVDVMSASCVRSTINVLTKP